MSRILKNSKAIIFKIVLVKIVLLAQLSIAVASDYVPVPRDYNTPNNYTPPPPQQYYPQQQVMQPPQQQIIVEQYPGSIQQPQPVQQAPINVEPSPEDSGSNIYISANYGISHVNLSTSCSIEKLSSKQFQAGVGYRLANTVRIETFGSYAGTYDTGTCSDITTWGFFLAGYYDFDISMGADAKGYFGGGIGIQYYDDNTLISGVPQDPLTGDSYMLSSGVLINVNKNIDFDVGARYTITDFGGSETWNSYAIYFGVKAHAN